MTPLARIDQAADAIAEKLGVDEVRVFPSLSADIEVGVRIGNQWRKVSLPADMQPKQIGVALVALARDARSVAGLATTLDDIAKKTAAMYGMKLEDLNTVEPETSATPVKVYAVATPVSATDWNQMAQAMIDTRQFVAGAYTQPALINDGKPYEQTFGPGAAAALVKMGVVSPEELVAREDNVGERCVGCGHGEKIHRDVTTSCALYGCDCTFFISPSPQKNPVQRTEKQPTTRFEAVVAEMEKENDKK